MPMINLVILVLTLTAEGAGNHGSAAPQALDGKLPAYSPQRTLTVAMEARNSVAETRPQSWGELERVLGVDVIPPGRETSLPPFDSQAVAQAVDSLSVDLVTAPPEDWNELADRLTPFTDVLPPDLIKNFIVQKVQDREGSQGDTEPSLEGREGRSRDSGPIVSDGQLSPFPTNQAQRDRGAPTGGSPPVRFNAHRPLARPSPKPSPLAEAKNQMRLQTAPKIKKLASLLTPPSPPGARSGPGTRAPIQAPRSPSSNKPKSVRPPESVISEDQNSAPRVSPLQPRRPTPGPSRPNGQVTLNQVRPDAGTTQGNPISPSEPKNLSAFPFASPPPPAAFRNPKTRANVTPAVGPSSSQSPSSRTTVPSLPTQPRLARLNSISDRSLAAALVRAFRHPPATPAVNVSRVHELSSPSAATLHALRAFSLYSPVARRLASTAGISVASGQRLYNVAKTTAWLATAAWLLALVLSGRGRSRP